MNRSLLCRLGLHDWLVHTDHVQRVTDGIWFDIDKQRCSRDECKYYWWREMNIEVSQHQRPLRIKV